MSAEEQQRLQELWRNGYNRASFSGQNILQKHTRAKRSVIREKVLPHLITYQKFRTTRKPSVYNPYFVRGKRKIIQSDLIFMDQPKEMIKKNKGLKYILIVQDIFSRKIWVAPLKQKTGAEVKLKLNSILEQMQPFNEDARFIIDRGSEYLNPQVKNLLKDYNINITHPSDGHASHVERVNLSLQRILFQKMTEQGKRKWINFLPQAVNIINDRYHRIIKMSPNEAELEDNRNTVIEAMSLYYQKSFEKEKDKKGRKKESKFKVGDQVRVQRAKQVFNRGYQPTFSNMVYKVVEILDHLPITMYKISEWDGEEVEGNFYAEELSLVKGDVFKIEKVLRRRTRNGIPSAYVKWEGFPNKYNSWIPITDIT
jgi:hypothetical protein